MESLNTLYSASTSYTLGRMLGKGCYGMVYFCQRPMSLPVVVKVFKVTKDSKNELNISERMSGTKLKGLLDLLDHGTIDDENTAKRLNTPLGSHFLVFKHLVGEPWSNGINVITEYV